MPDQPVFDGVAQRYDDDFSNTHTGKLQRDRVHTLIRPWLVGTALQVLELNCGTGVDAIWMAQQGHRVWATDLSGGMVAETRARALREGVSEKVTAQEVGFEQIAEVADAAPFDAVFSNFGGLNCLDHAGLRQLSNDLGQMMASGGIFIAVMMPRGCVWERLYFMAKFQWGKAFRRRATEAVQAPLQDGSFQPTWYFRPKEFADCFSTHFEPVAQWPIGIALPPSYLDPMVAQRPRFLQRLIRWEQRLAKPWLANAGDHCLVVMRRR